jgi:4-hydroxy-tetrahydrodipicolinate synthase
VFRGLSAFPLTPLHDDRVDVEAFRGLVRRLATARVDSITALGSTGSYAYLSREERAAVVAAAVDEAGDVPVLAGIGALRTSEVRRLADDAQEAGAAGVLLAPVSYQALTDDDVLGLYEEVTQGLSVPLIVYDNPGTTHFTFTDALYARVAALPGVGSLKIPGVPDDPEAAARRVRRLRELVPPGVTLGVAGDAYGAAGLNAGCDAWYSVIAGTLPEHPLAIARAAQEGRHEHAAELSEQWRPLWELFGRFGSLRVTAAIAELLGLVRQPSLPRPILGLRGEDREAVRAVVSRLGL